MGMETPRKNPEQNSFATSAQQTEKKALIASVDQEKKPEKPDLPKVLEMTSEFAANETASQRKAA